MRRAFDLAGARTVIASQWAVEDDATREWMQALYSARSAGSTTAAAALESASRRDTRRTPARRAIDPPLLLGRLWSERRMHARK